MTHLHLALLTALLALVAGPAAAQTVYKCPGPNGSPVFQDSPCVGAKGAQVDATPANVIEGNPSGEAALRGQAQRSSYVRSAQARGLVVDGMTQSEMQQVMGQPLVVNTDLYNGQVRQQHVYRDGAGGRRYIYTTNGVVTAVQERPAPVGSPRQQRCYTALEIGNAETSASSITLPPDQRAAMHRRLDHMRAARC